MIVTEFKKDDDEEGLPEKTLIRNNTFYELVIVKSVVP